MSLFERIAAAARPAGIAVYGEAITYVPAGGEGAAVAGIWSDAADDRWAGILEVRSADLPDGFAKNDRVVRGERLYRVAGFVGAAGEVVDLPHVDELGNVKLALRAASGA